MCSIWIAETSRKFQTVWARRFSKRHVRPEEFDVLAPSCCKLATKLRRDGDPGQKSLASVRSRSYQ